VSAAQAPSRAFPGMLEPVDSESGRYRASGDWRLEHAPALARSVADVGSTLAHLDARAVDRLDSAGALLMLQAVRRANLDAGALAVRDEHRALVEAVAAATAGEPEEPPALHPVLAFLDRVGRATAGVASELGQLMSFLGLTVTRIGAVLVRPARVRLTSVVHHMERTGLDALPLVLLLSFLVGAVVTFLGATVLRDFGAEIFVVELTSYAFMREFGVLLTAILLAGRTASAFTAQIGTMKSREEIDAMTAIGLDPIELLVLPRLFALLIMLPLLAVLAMLAGLAGGLIVGWLSLGIGPDLFVTRLQETMELRHYLVGLSKAPVFAVVIALVGCLEGFKVAGTAQSVGERTTSSVVQSITLVIVIDAFAAVLFMEMGW
jgi:phospholipid/cholesterol/gamma-HCH transport system permease protein